jgi:hypothetical protein
LAANVSITWNILGNIDLVAAIILGITISNPQPPPLSQGRVMSGLGLGWSKDEYQ